MPYIIYADIESLIKKVNGCANNPGNSSATKIGEHILCGYLMPTIWAFDNIENRHTSYRGEDCMKKFCTFLREHATNVIIFEKKKMLPLTKKELKSHQDARACYICGKRLLKKLLMINIIEKLGTIVIFQVNKEAHSICNLKFNVPDEIPVVFHNGSNNDDQFIIKI